MKKLILIIAIAFVSCSKSTTNQTTTSNTDVATIIEAVKVYEPNGSIGRKITFKTSIFSATTLSVYKGGYKYEWWSTFTPTITFYDHYAGEGEIFYTFNWQYANGTEYWQTPQRTTVK
jgi:hypothetical protein